MFVPVSQFIKILKQKMVKACLLCMIYCWAGMLRVQGTGAG